MDGKIRKCSFKGTVTGSDLCGGICGNSWNSEISDCKNSGTVNGYSATGGICGTFGNDRDDCGLFRCENDGTIECTQRSDAGGGGAGGICGAVSGLVADCVNKGMVTNNVSFYGAGGITGLIGGFAGGMGIVEYCRNEGKIISSGNAAGICSEFCGGEIRNSYNSGRVEDGTNNEHCGGIVGSLANVESSTRTVSNCFFLNSSCDRGAISIVDTGIVGCDNENLESVVENLGDHFVYEDGNVELSWED